MQSSTVNVNDLIKQVVDRIKPVVNRMNPLIDKVKSSLTKMGWTKKVSKEDIAKLGNYSL